MKFLVSKNDNFFCFHCGANILAKEHFLLVFRAGRRRLLFHVDCYRRWYDDLIVRKYLEWREGITPSNRRRIKRKQGRPPLYKSGVQARRLQSLLHHYRKAGNEVKVKELEAALEALKIGVEVSEDTSSS